MARVKKWHLSVKEKHLKFKEEYLLYAMFANVLTFMVYLVLLIPLIVMFTRSVNDAFDIGELDIPKAEEDDNEEYRWISQCHG